MGKNVSCLSLWAILCFGLFGRKEMRGSLERESKNRCNLRMIFNYSPSIGLKIEENLRIWLGLIGVILLGLIDFVCFLGEGEGFRFVSCVSWGFGVSSGY